MNVSLPESQEQFVKSQVAHGRYRTASEVVRDGLRLLEQAEHRRLVEKWIYEDLSEEELASLPTKLKARVKAHFKALVDEAMEDIETGRVVDGPATLEKMRKDLKARKG